MCVYIYIYICIYIYIYIYICIASPWHTAGDPIHSRVPRRRAVPDSTNNTGHDICICT